jgi:CheY-like chemotaxis protein
MRSFPRRFAVRLVAAMLVVSLPLMIVLALVLTRDVSSTLTATAELEGGTASRGAALRLEDWLSERQDNLSVIAGSAADHLATPETTAELVEFDKTYDDFSLIEVSDLAGSVLSSSRTGAERAGFEVRVAVDGMDALSQLAEMPSDLILTDVEMPNMDGFELTEAVRAHASLANIPVLILSSRSSEADRLRGLNAGADGYIVKSSFDEGSLLAAVRRLIGGRA